MNYLFKNIKKYGCSNIDIEEACEKLSINLNKCCMKDELDLKHLYNGGYIINLANSDQNGTHWTSFFKDGSNIYYFDSYGVVPAQDEAILFKKNHDKLYYNKIQIQDFESNVCGLFCILFLWICQNLKRPYEGINFTLSLFNREREDLKLNDDLLIDYIKALF